ncbi:transglycosylase family protein [Mycobacterium sp. SA01]|uniref:transglycosylase family protein n=1 Tax=Mycobacterium sp. SA01 TaxID=3238820 RepID=UPI00351AF172
MTEPHDGGTEGVAWVDIAGSAAGLIEAMEKVGREASGRFAAAFKQGLGSEFGLGNLTQQLGSASGSMEHLGIVAGATGGLVVAGMEAAGEGVEGLIDISKELVKGLYEIGETWEGVNRKLQATTTATGEDLEGLKDVIGSVGAHTAASFETIEAATAVLAQRTGLRGGALQQLVTDFADAGEMLGKAIDPGAFSAAMAAMNVPFSQADQWLNSLFNISRQTSVPLGELVTTLRENGAALHEFGLDAMPVASLLAQMQANGINAQQAMRGLQSVSKEAAKDHETLAQYLKTVVAGMVAAKDTGDRIAENGWAAKLGRGAVQFEAAVDQGILSVESLGSAFDNLPTDGISDVYDRTATLSDKIAELGHEINVDLMPVGEAITENLGGAFDKLSSWVNTHGPEIVDWITHVGDAAIWVGGQIAAAAGDLMDAAGGLESAYGSLTGDDATQKAGDHLSDLGRHLSDAGQHTDALTKSFDDLMAKAREQITVVQDLQDAVKAGPDGKGVQLTDSANLERDLDALRQAGVDISKGDAGQLEFTADTPENQKRVREFLESLGAKDVDVPIVPRPTGPDGPGTPPPADPKSLFGIPPDGIKVPVAPEMKIPDTAGTPPGGYPSGQFMPGAHNFGDWLYRLLGGAPIWAPDQPEPPTPPPPPGVPVDPSKILQGGGSQPPATLPGLLLPVAPSAYKLPVGQILDGAGIPTANQGPQGVVVPTSLTVQTGDQLDPDGLMGKAGIGSKYLGQIPDGSEGVVLPTAFDVKDNEQKSLSDLMESIGIPTENQGADGVTIPTSFTLPTGGPAAAGVPGVIPAGNTTGGSGVNWDAIAQHESGGNWSLPSDSKGRPFRGGLQILDSTWQQFGGTAYAPTADKATKEQQIAIAEKILAGQGPGAWPNTFKYGAPSGAPGVGGGSYAGIAATDNGSTNLPRYGGIPGAPSGVGQDVLAFMKQVMDQFNAAAGAHLSVTADYPGGPTGHPDDGADHSVRRALDISGSSAEMDAFAAMIANNPTLRDATRQLIHNPDGDGGSTFTDNMNIIGGHLTNGWQTYGSGGEGMPGHANHDHWALQYIPGAASAATGTVAPADYTPGTGGQVFTVGRITRDDGNPTTPAPTAPGAQFNSVPPPPNIPQAAPGATNTIDTPFGSFQHSWDMPDKGASMTPEQRVKLDTWLNSYTDALEAATDATDAVTRAQQRVDKALAKKNDADAAVLPGDPDTTNAAATADQEYVDATEALARAKRHAADEQNRQNLEAEKPAPWESTKSSSKERPDQNAETLGKGFLKGVMQELGFPDVFAKSPADWGITKLLTGGAGYGLNLLQNMGQTNTGLYAPGGPLASLAGQTPGGSSSGGTDGGLMSFAEGAIPGLKQLMHSVTNGNPAVTPSTWNSGPPAPASNTPAGIGSSSPVNIPAAAATGPGTTTNSNLTIANTYQGFNPTPQVKDQVAQIAHTTSAPAMAGGAGIPL